MNHTIDDDGITLFTIIYNNGNGKMVLKLEVFFDRHPKGKFIHTIKSDIYKVLALVNEWCEVDDILFLLKWLEENECKDIAEYYIKKYNWIKEYLQ